MTLLYKIRQQIYLRALKTLPKVEFFYGHFLTHESKMPIVGCPPGIQRFAKVMKTEEKGSDVNLATHLINDAYKREIDVAALITNDSDLLEPVRIVREELKLIVGIINPHKKQSRTLVQYASFVKRIRKGALSASQFSKTLQDANGKFHKPKSW